MNENDPIKHVVLLIMENHSFDQMLGCFKSIYPHLEGVDPHNLHSNTDSNGTVYQQKPSEERQMSLDPHPMRCRMFEFSWKIVMGVLLRTFHRAFLKVPKKHVNLS